MTTLLHDAFRHHAWAIDRVLEVCRSLTPEQLATPCPGTYGPILDTLRHLVGSDRWYLWVITDHKVEQLDADTMSIDELPAAAASSATSWEELLDGDLDPDTDVARVEDDWEFHAPMGMRLAQVIHHGTDHRSQVCTALTSLGIEPPDIDVWAWGEATNRSHAVGEIPD